MSNREEGIPPERPGKRQKVGSYVLHYWDGIPGRGEYIRLVFEYTGTPYDDRKDNSGLMPRITNPETAGIPPNLWPPALELPNGKFISQTGVIIDYLSPKLGLAGYAKDDSNLDEEDKTFLQAKNAQLVCTTLDLMVETHNVHHPVSANLSYEDQKAEAARAAGIFRASRLLKFFKHFQLVLETNPANEDGKGTVFRFNTIFETIYNVVNVNEGPFLLSDLTTSADLALFYTMNGLFYAFPRRMKNVEESKNYNLVFKLYDRIKEEPKIADYMKSNRRQHFKLIGIFRHYPELDNEE